MLKATAYVSNGYQYERKKFFYTSPEEMCQVPSPRGHTCVLPKAFEHSYHATYAKHMEPEWRS